MSAADFATNSDYGTCPECGRPYQLTSKGVLRKHWKRDADGRAVNALSNVACAGAGQKPKEEC